MQKMVAIRKVFLQKKIAEPKTVKGFEEVFKNIFYNHVLAYIYTRVGKIVEREAIQDFFSHYDLTEFDWEFDSAVKCWNRYKRKMKLCETSIFEAKIFQPRKLVRRQIFLQNLFLF